MSEVRLGALCWNQHTDWPTLLEAGRRADRLGYHSLGTWDQRTVVELGQYLLTLGAPRLLGMRLDGPEGQSLELTVTGYENPDMTPGTWLDHDANFVVVAGKVSDGSRSWQFDSACMLTVDVGTLAVWFEAMADGRSVPEEFEPIEPDLAFRRVHCGSEDDTALRVTFEFEARPPWNRTRYEEDDWGSVWLDFPVTADLLRAAARDLRADLERFPERRSSVH